MHPINSTLNPDCFSYSRHYETFHEKDLNVAGFLSSREHGVRYAAELVGAHLRSCRSAAVDLGGLPHTPGLTHRDVLEKASSTRQPQAVRGCSEEHRHRSR